MLAGCTAFSAHALSDKEKRIAAWVTAHADEATAFLIRSVDIPSATHNVAGVRQVGELYAAELRKIGFATRWAEMPPEMHRAGHLIAERKGGKGKRILLIGHLDTVLEGKPFTREGNVGRGPGVNDMKGGNAVILWALQALEHAAALNDRTITVVFTGDEEDVGDPKDVARRHLVELARRSDVALSFETAVGNSAVIARRGVTTWRLQVRGATGHSSGIFKEELGSGAIFEAARILDRFHESLREKYLTYNASVIVGGTEAELDSESRRGKAWGKTNVVPQRVMVDGDLRFLSEEQRESAKQKMRDIVSSKNHPRTSAEILFHDEYPSMPPTDGNMALLRELDRVSRDLGQGEITPYDPGARGAGDISFVASHVDCLDGLGAMGKGAHSPDETAELDKLPMLITRAALLIHRLTR
ncbi:MAG TPA: M20/M25/M40 family metallo-hydrolase [Myxococcaceae bacterium]|nr:M20/M25/M40 family metallo-hydrolase [Myxococcaceae bacterium]